MKNLFGSDGVRGVAISELTCETAMLIGRAAAVVLSKRNHRRAKLLIGKDTRISCDVLEAALISGICSAGADAHILGVLPTPAVAYLTVKYGADAGIMISASHNSFEFNGIKLFSASGHSLSSDIKKEIERYISENPDELSDLDPTQIGSIKTEKNAEWDYVRYLLRCVDTDVSRMKIVVDCANGAACSCAEKFFRGLGANVVLINNTPDGININLNCGSTNLESLSKAVIEQRAHIGIALDGDGDRCLMVDEKGEPLDGDRMIALLALDMKEEGKLFANTCVVNQMTNLGFYRWAKENGIVVSTASGVGSRYIIERMATDGYNLGGEQSGHVVFSDVSTTGDGELCAAKMLEIVAKKKCRLSDLAGIFEPYPQLLLNVKIKPEFSKKWSDISEITEMINYCSEKLSGDGRVLVRESETEPVLRIMVEGRDKDAIYQYAHAIAQVAAEHIGDKEQ